MAKRNANTSEYPGYRNLEVMKSAKRYNRFLVDQVASCMPAGSRMLDFGAGMGTFATALRERGYEVECVEPDDIMRSGLLDLGFAAHPDIGSLEDECLTCIYTLNVLEHIENDSLVLQELYRKLKKGGRLYVYVPAFMVLFSSMDREVGHYRRYKKESLGRVLTEIGFHVDRTAYVDSLGFVASILFKYLSPQSGELNPRTLAFYDSVVFPVSRGFDLVAKRWFGKNLSVVCTKPIL